MYINLPFSRNDKKTLKMHTTKTFKGNIFSLVYSYVIYGIEVGVPQILLSLISLGDYWTRVFNILSGRTAAIACFDLKISKSDQIHEFLCLIRFFKYHDLGSEYFYQRTFLLG